MISQIQGNVNKPIFEPIQGVDVHYAVSKPFTKEQQKEFKKAQIKEEDKNESKLGIRIAEIAVFTTLIVFALLRGAPKSWRNLLDKKYKNLVDEEKARELINKTQAVKQKSQWLRRQIQSKLKSFTSSSKAIFNLAPLKDILVTKVLDQTSVGRNIAKRITAVFEKISIKTSKQSYNKTASKFDTMYAVFADANKKLRVINKEDADFVENRIAHIKKTYDDAFSENARNNRLRKIKSHFDGFDDNGVYHPKTSLKDKVWAKTYEKMNNFLQRNTYSTFISEELAAKEKMRAYNEIHAHKTLISNSIDDICEATFNLFIHMDTFVEATDKPIRDNIKIAVNKLKEYQKAAKLKKSSDELRIGLMDGKIFTALNNIYNALQKTKAYDKEIVQVTSENIKQLIDIYNYNTRGDIQSIMGVYKRTLDPRDYQKIKQQTNSTIKSFNKSTDMESDKLFDKIRDLKIGSAPKDTLGVLASLGVIGYQLKNANNRDERISVTIKYGVPTIGGVLVALYCTVGLISAGPSLLIGLASGLALNQIGEIVDHLRKKYLSSKLKFTNFALPESVQTIRKNLDIQQAISLTKPSKN